MTRIVDPVLRHLRELTLRMGSCSEAILTKALRSIWERDAALAAEVQEDDIEIDRLDVEIDDEVLKTLALQAPVAGDLREVIAIKMIANDLERVGDLARNIAKSANRLSSHAETTLPPQFRTLARDAQSVLRRSLDAFGNHDGQLARQVLAEDSRIDAEEDQVVLAALREIPLHPDQASEAVDMIMIAKHLERVADHATNIAESVILVAEARNVKHAVKLSR
jgi:phosphate transport system protein